MPRLKESQIIAESLVRASRGTTQAIANTTTVVVLFNTEQWDIAGEYDTSNGRFTPIKAGKYRVHAQIRFTGTGGNTNTINIRKNGTTVVSDNNYPNAAAYGVIRADDTVDLAVGDYIEITAYQNSGASRDIDAYGLANYVTIERVA